MGKECQTRVSRRLWGGVKYDSPENDCVGGYVLKGFKRVKHCPQQLSALGHCCGKFKVRSVVLLMFNFGCFMLQRCAVIWAACSPNVTLSLFSKLLSAMEAIFIAYWSVG